MISPPPFQSSLSPIFSRYQETKKLYPWTEHPDPYAVWISEIMLQQTVVQTVIPYFNQWMKSFPDIGILAKTKEEELLRLWEGLGYYSRCRNILKAAKIIVEQHNGHLPSSFDQLKALPGLGDYTSKAILCQGFNIPSVAVDANIKRIALRVFFSKKNYIWNAKTEKSIIPHFEKESLYHSPPLFHNALMQFGQQICRAKSPLCKECPIQSNCLAFAKGTQERIPRKIKKTITQKNSRLTLVLQSATNEKPPKIAMIQRDKGIGRGLWFIPKEDDLSSELKKALPSNPQSLKKRIHFYTTNKEELNPFLYRLPSYIQPDEIASEERENLKWFDLSKISDLPVPSVYRKILDELDQL